MVSPINKDNGDILTLIDITGYQTRLNQSAADGEALTYSSYRSFGSPLGAPYTAQYLARRDAAGWSSEPLAGPLTGNFYGSALVDNEFKAFNANLCQSWLVPGGGPILAPGATEGFPNLYRRANCPKGYETLSTVGPPRIKAKNYIPELQGYSADGAKAIFRVNDTLTADARPQPPGCSPDGVGCQMRLYEASGGALRSVCVFPEGTSAKAEAEFPNCSAGTPSPVEFAEGAVTKTASVSHAMSEDGTRIYWSASAEENKPGKIYLRLNGSNTLKVSETQTSKAARFWGGAADGSKALFEVEDPSTAKNRNLYLYDLASEESTLIAGKVTAVAAASKDLARVYFISEEKLAGTTAPSAGKENLYLDEEGAESFIATLSARDVGQGEISDAAREPIYHVAQASADGGRLAFISTEELTGFDNRDAASGEADSEVFSYDAETGELSCASCSPVGARAEGRHIAAPATSLFLWTAATIPAGETDLYTPRAVSNDNSRLFFTSYTPLLPTDVNHKADVYEWERAGKRKAVKAKPIPDFYAANGGCLFLISSGESGTDSELIDSSPSGRDVFFSTEESLLPQDPALVDIYDAREGGGLPGPAPEPIECDPEGGGCQNPGPAPALQGGASNGPPGPGNPKPIAACPKGKHRSLKKGKEVCLKNKQKKGKGKAKNKPQKAKRAPK